VFSVVNLYLPISDQAKISFWEIPASRPGMRNIFRFAVAKAAVFSPLCR